MEIEVLRDWIDSRLGELVRSKASRLQERQREFVDGSIDALLALRGQFCANGLSRTGPGEDAPRSNTRKEQRRKVEAPQTARAVC